MIRHCIKCNAEISECMGSVLARDIIAFQDGKNPNKIFREHCGKCVMYMCYVISPEEVRAYLIGLGEVYDNPSK